MYRKFEDIKPVIEDHFINLYKGKTIGLPLYSTLEEFVHHAEEALKFEYLGILYSAIKDLLSEWYTPHYILEEIFGEHVYLKEIRSYKHDPPIFDTPHVIQTTKYIYDGYLKREIENGDQYYTLIEEIFPAKTKLEVYEDPKWEKYEQIYEWKYQNEQQIKNELEELFKNRKTKMPKRTFEYYIEWITGDPHKSESEVERKPHTVISLFYHYRKENINLQTADSIA